MGHSEAELEDASVATLSKWITTAKRLFTISTKDVDTRLNNLAQIETSQVFQRDLQVSMETLRKRYETLRFYYINLEEKTEPDVFRERYQPYIDNLEKTKDENEEAFSTALVSAKQSTSLTRTEEGELASYKVEPSLKATKYKNEEISEFMAKEAHLETRDADVAKITSEEQTAHFLMAGITARELGKKPLGAQEDQLLTMDLKEDDWLAFGLPTSIKMSHDPEMPSDDNLCSNLLRKTSNLFSFSDPLQAAVSCLYAKLLVILGLALPLAEVLSDTIQHGLFQIFYVYLFLVSTLYLLFVYLDLAQTRARYILAARQADNQDPSYPTPPFRPSTSGYYGSFYLRLGTVGISSLPITTQASTISFQSLALEASSMPGWSLERYWRIAMEIQQLCPGDNPLNFQS